MIIVKRFINGITVNGYDYLLDKHGKLIQFHSEADARTYLMSRGLSKADCDLFEYERPGSAGIY